MSGPAQAPVVNEFESPHAEAYAQVLHGLDNPFANFLKAFHGVSGSLRVGHTLGAGSWSVVEDLAAAEALMQISRGDRGHQSQNPWTQAFTRRYAATDASVANRDDATIREVIQDAEKWVKKLTKAILNIERVFDKSTSTELAMFTAVNSEKKKSVEATSRSVLIALIHRCVVGHCGMIKTCVYPSREDKKFNCKERLEAVIYALKYDKRICRDVMIEDAKITTLVHCPTQVGKIKQNQQKSNDLKRARLIQADAVRFNAEAGVSSGSACASQVTEPAESSQEPELAPTAVSSEPKGKATAALSKPQPEPEPAVAPAASQSKGKAAAVVSRYKLVPKPKLGPTLALAECQGKGKGKAAAALLKAKLAPTAIAPKLKSSISAKRQTSKAADTLNGLPPIQIEAPTWAWGNMSFYKPPTAASGPTSSSYPTPHTATFSPALSHVNPSYPSVSSTTTLGPYASLQSSGSTLALGGYPGYQAAGSTPTGGAYAGYQPTGSACTVGICAGYQPTGSTSTVGAYPGYQLQLTGPDQLPPAFPTGPPGGPAPVLGSYSSHPSAGSPPKIGLFSVTKPTTSPRVSQASTPVNKAAGSPLKTVSFPVQKFAGSPRKLGSFDVNKAAGSASKLVSFPIRKFARSPPKMGTFRIMEPADLPLQLGNIPVFRSTSSLAKQIKLPVRKPEDFIPNAGPFAVGDLLSSDGFKKAASVLNEERGFKNRALPKSRKNKAYKRALVNTGEGSNAGAAKVTDSVINSQEDVHMESADVIQVKTGEATNAGAAKVTDSLDNPQEDIHMEGVDVTQVETGEVVNAGTAKITDSVINPQEDVHMEGDDAVHVETNKV